MGIFIRGEAYFSRIFKDFKNLILEGVLQGVDELFANADADTRNSTVAAVASFGRWEWRAGERAHQWFA